MRRVVVPTGYMGSGSSAITNLVSEFQDYCGKCGSQEFVFLHCPLGVFDLEDRLLHGNNIYISDEYLHLFRMRMKELNFKRFWWPSGYQHFVGKEFMSYVDEFIDSLVDYRMDQFWYMSELPTNAKLTIKKAKNAIGQRIFGKKYFRKPVLNRSGVQFSYPTEEKFYACARKFIVQVIEAISKNENVILDQLLLPYNLNRMSNYFKKGEVKVIVVERDPRDVFIQNKYFYSKAHVEIPYPKDVEEFCLFYRHIRGIEQVEENEDILRIHFEELVYEYEESLEKIYRFLEVEPESHVKKKEIFNPEKSINNTQLFLLEEEYKKEAEYIEQHLEEYLYHFPEERIADALQTFIYE